MGKGLGIFISNDKATWAIAEMKDGKPFVHSSGAFSLDALDHPVIPGDIPDDIAVCFSIADSFFYPMSFPFASRSRIMAVLKNDIEDKSLDPPDSIVADFYSVESADKETKGFGITLPKEKVARVIQIPGEQKQPVLVTLDIFTVAALLHKTASTKRERYFLVEFAENTGFIAEIEGRTIKQVRSIPANIDSAEAALEVIQELIKRFTIENVKEDLYVFSGVEEVNTILNDSPDFPYKMVDIEIACINNGNGSGLFLPVSAALAALHPGEYPNFRQEDLRYSGIFSALSNHSIIFLGILSAFFLVMILWLLHLRGDYEQEIRSINARMNEASELVIEKAVLERELKKPGMTLIDVVRKVTAEYRIKDSGVESIVLPESAFRILNEIFSYFPEDKLDVSWERISVTQKLISINGKFVGEETDLSLFDSFVSKLSGSGKFKIKSKQVSGGNSFRLSLEYLKEEK